MKKYIKPIVREVVICNASILAGSPDQPSAGFVDGETESADAKGSSIWSWTDEEE